MGIPPFIHLPLPWEGEEEEEGGGGASREIFEILEGSFVTLAAFSECLRVKEKLTRRPRHLPSRRPTKTAPHQRPRINRWKMDPKLNWKRFSKR